MLWQIRAILSLVKFFLKEKICRAPLLILRWCTEIYDRSRCLCSTATEGYREDFWGPSFSSGDYTESKPHLLGMVNTCALAAHFTQSCWIKPLPSPSPTASQLIRCLLPAPRQPRAVSGKKDPGPWGRRGWRGQRWTGVGKCIPGKRSGRRKGEKKGKDRIRTLCSWIFLNSLALCNSPFSLTFQSYLP